MISGTEPRVAEISDEDLVYSRGVADRMISYSQGLRDAYQAEIDRRAAEVEASERPAPIKLSDLLGAL